MGLTLEMHTELKRNQELIVTIIDLSYEGLGVAKIDHYPIFVENALPGEEVNIHLTKVGKKFAFAKTIEIIKQSPDRVEIFDRKLTQVGIAPLQHLTYSKQLEFKQEQVKKTFTKTMTIAEDVFHPIIGMDNPFHYRNKAQVPVREYNGTLELGFFRKNSHDLVIIDDFLIQDEKIDAVILILKKICQDFKLEPYNEKNHSGTLRHIVVRRGHYSHEIMIVFVTRTAKLPNSEVLCQLIHEKIPEVVSIVQNIQGEKSNVILGKRTKLLSGKLSITDTLLDKTYQISANSFYQVNTVQAEKLYSTAIDFAEFLKSDIVIDAYTGIGTIALSVADHVKHVYAMEINPHAISDAETNAKNNKIKNVTFEVGDGEVVLSNWDSHGIKADAIIVDPPRKGLSHSFIQSVISMKPKKIIYISCNPATLVRDSEILSQENYTIKKVQPVDMFPQTTHIESIVLFEKK